MTRKKPFSNKQKKAQLQLKRQQKKGVRRDDLENVGSVDAFLGPTTPKKQNRKKNRPNGGGRANTALKRLPADLRTVFEPEPKELIQKRIRESENPIKRGNEKSLRTQDTNLYSAIIDLPKRPPWTSEMTADEVESNEEKYFEEWLRDIYQYPIERLNFFEHNLQVWRQLWRVCEMSDVLVLVADIRHPLFHFPPSLYEYVTQYHKKPLILLLNKTDLVSSERVQVWKEYFELTYPHLRVIPFSTHTELKHVNDEFTVKHKRLKKGKMSHRYLGARGGAGLIQAILDLAFPGEDNGILTQEEIDKFEYTPPDPTDVEERGPNYQPAPKYGTNEDIPEEQEEEEPEEQEEEEPEEDEENAESKEESTEDELCPQDHVPQKEVESDSQDQEKRKIRKYRVIGMIGHPNVGKSSLINGMKKKKVVSTSRTPGHTKHFQTIFLTEKICLCDCPGLVFPALDMKKELQILCGLFPIAQAREPYSALRYLAERVRVEEIYKLEPPPDEQDVYNRSNYPWSGRNIAQCYAIKRGYRSKGGREDSYRAGLEILKDTLDGVIGLAFDPPQIE